MRNFSRPRVFALILAVVFFNQRVGQAQKPKISRIILDGGGFYLDPGEENRTVQGGDGFAFVVIESESFHYNLQCPRSQLIRILRVNNNPVHVGCLKADASGPPVA